MWGRDKNFQVSMMYELLKVFIAQPLIVPSSPNHKRNPQLLGLGTAQVMGIAFIFDGSLFKGKRYFLSDVL